MEAIYARIKEKRVAAKLKQIDIAEKINLSQGAYARLERGETEITLERVKQIADIFGMTEFELMGFNKKEYDDLDKVEAIAQIQYLAERVQKLEAEKEEVYESESELTTKTYRLEDKIKELEKKVKEKDSVISTNSKVYEDRIKDKDKMIDILERLLQSQSKA